MNIKALNTMIRDLGSTLAGLGILAHQTLVAKEPHAVLLLTAMALLAVPGATGLLSLWINGKANGSGIPDSAFSSQSSTSSLRSTSSGGGE